MARDDDGVGARPFLRWPGGKRLLAGEILRHLPQAPARYVEPFLGSGAIFFAVAPKSALLSDLNADLVELYVVVRDHVEDVIAGLGRLPQDEATYYRLRSQSASSPIDRAVRFLYLNRLSFNGIWRVNRLGQYNVPYGKRLRSDLVTEDKLRAASRLLKRAVLLTGDFSVAVSQSGPGDVIYADPPYTLRHASNGFRKYNDVLFSWSDQERLVADLRAAAGRGVAVVVSNAYHPTIRELYCGFAEVEVERGSRLAARRENRTRVKESLYFLAPLEVETHGR